jgi:DNA-binding LacI/PurR family transcriptional regulator
MATIVDVARLAGVGTTTVTKVLTDHPHVSQATRKRVLDAIAALDYHPSAAGRMLRTGVAHVLGVITPPPSTHPFAHTFFPYVLEGIGECAAEHEYDILWITANGFREAQRPYSALFKTKRVDGVIDIHTDVRDPGLELLRAGGHPFVLVGHPEDTSLPHVDVANHDAGLTVGRAFLARRYASVGFLGVAGSPASLDRLAGLRLALAEVGLAIRPNHVVMLKRDDQTQGLEAFGRDATRTWIERGCAPRAVLTSTDRIAYGLMRACHLAGLRLPDDLAVVGFDDEPMSAHLDPPLASVEQPVHRLGYEAAGFLLRILAGDPPDPPVHVLPTRLIERASLGSLND